MIKGAVDSARSSSAATGLECITVFQVRHGYLPNLGVAASPQSLECKEECGHAVVGKTVPDVRAVAPSLDQACLPQGAQVSARVLNGRGGLTGELFPGLLALAQEIQQLESLGTRDRLGRSERTGCAWRP